MCDYLGVIGLLKESGQTQEQIGGVIGWSDDKVKKHSALLSSLSATNIDLAKSSQTGRVTDEVTNVTFTEGWFRDILKLNPTNQELIIIKDNLLRRHLDDFQKVNAGERLEVIEREKAKVKQQKAGEMYGESHPKEQEVVAEIPPAPKHLTDRERVKYIEQIEVQERSQLETLKPATLQHLVIRWFGRYMLSKITYMYLLHVKYNNMYKD